jgi:translation initiation factor 2 subunit 1
MIHVSEVAGKWVKDIRKFVKPNKQYVTRVVRIDYQKGHINLSIKRVSKVDKRDKMDSYRNEKRARGMLLQTAKRLGMDEGDLMKELGPKLSEFGEIYDAFERINEDRELLDTLGLSKDLKAALTDVMEQNFRVKEKSIKAVLILSSTAPDGARKIKGIMAELEKDTGADIRYISAPKYRVKIMSKDPKAAEKKLREGMDAALEKARKADGEGSYEFIR